MVSALDYGSSVPGLSVGQGHCVVFLARHFIVTLPLSMQEYKWVPVNCQGNLTKSHPGGVAILLVGVMLHKPG